MLKPNGISHTVYPDQAAESFNDWTANFTRQEVARDADDFKEKVDNLWADTYYRLPTEEYKEKFDKLWDAFKKSIQNQ